MSVINEAVRIQHLERPTAVSLKAQRLLGTSKAQQVLGDLKPKRKWYQTRCDWYRTKQLCKGLYKRLGIKHLVPAFIIVLYTIIGGGIFMALERESDTEHRADIVEKLDVKRDEATDKLVDIFDAAKIRKEDNRTALVELAAQALRAYERERDHITQMSFSEETVWDFWNSMYFCGTLYTTIGYGNIACNTAAGQVITIFYALIGIPLVLTTLNDLGIFLFNTIRKVLDMGNYLQSCSFIPLRYRNWLNLKLGRPMIKPKLSRTSLRDKQHSLDIPYVDSDSYDPEAGRTHYNNGAHAAADYVDSSDEKKTDTKSMPVTAALVVTIGWIFLCSGVFCIWETNWTYFTSVYFFVISLSTIGLGDVVPDHPKLMIIMFGLVIIGLSLVSMCISVVQNKLEDLYFILLMRLLEEYQRRLNESGEMGATMGMMDSFANSKTSKLLKFLPKGKMNSAMDRFQEEAKAQGLAIPPILQQTDRKTGLPSVLAVENRSSEDEEYKQKLQEAIDHAEEATQTAAPGPIVAPQQPEIVAYDQDTQTDYVYLSERGNQTIPSVTESSSVQTLLSSLNLEDRECQTSALEYACQEAQTLPQPQPVLSELACQTLTAPVNNVDTQTCILTDDSCIQSLLSSFNITETSSQTVLKDHLQVGTQTPAEVKPTFAVEECQTVEILTSDLEVQTPIVPCYNAEVQSHLFDMRETDSQTAIIQCFELETQTFQQPTADRKLQTHLYDVNNAKTQTRDPPTLNDEEQQTTPIEHDNQEAQTDVPYPTRTATEMSNLDKLRKAFQKRKKEKRSYSAADVKLPTLEARKLETLGSVIAESDEEEEEEDEEEDEDEDEETTDENLQWDPIDGMHAEKQRPVTSLRQMFESGQTIEKRPPPPVSRYGSRSFSRQGSTSSTFGRK